MPVIPFQISEKVSGLRNRRPQSPFCTSITVLTPRYQILATRSDGAPQSSDDIIGVIAHLTRFPPELCLMVIENLSYQDLVSFALTSKSMAKSVLELPNYPKLAAKEEAEHDGLGHHQILCRLFGSFSGPFPRSKIFCTWYTCPWYNRKTRGTLAKRCKQGRR